MSVVHLDYLGTLVLLCINLAGAKFSFYKKDAVRLRCPAQKPRKHDLSDHSIQFNLIVYYHVRAEWLTFLGSTASKCRAIWRIASLKSATSSAKTKVVYSRINKWFRENNLY